MKRSKVEETGKMDGKEFKKALDAIVKEKGIDKIQEHTKDFINKRLAQAVIQNDGKQTPMRGHPVFIAQHATGCCCRGCLYKWHKIPKGVELSEEQKNYICEVIMTWIQREIKRNGENI